MKLTTSSIEQHNQSLLSPHQRQFRFLAETLTEQGIDIEAIIRQVIDFQISIPSWALGTGGTRFGRFPIGGEPRNLEEKIADVGLLNFLNRSANSISLHIRPNLISFSSFSMNW